MSRMGLRLILALFTLFLAFFVLFPTSAQADIGRNGGTCELKTDTEMMSGIPVHGGGHATWKISGTAANELRAAIILNFDVPRGQEPPNGQLEVDEVERFAIELERYLEREELEFHGSNIRRWALLNRDVRDDTKGLISTSNATSDDIEIRYYFDAWMPSGEEDVSLSDTTLADAIFVPVNETFYGTYKLDHMEYMVNIADWEDIKINKGNFFLIRTPFGEIYHYSVTFEADSNPEDRCLYQPFSWLECPLILFIAVIVLGYFVVTMPGRFRRYDVMKIVKLHTLAKVLLIVMLLLYFIAAIGDVFIGGVYLWIMSVAFLFISLVISKTMYESAERITQMPKKPEPAAPIIEEEPEEEIEEAKGRAVQCATCGEIYTMDEMYHISSAPCPACGSIGAVEMGVAQEPPPPPIPETPPPPPEQPKKVKKKVVKE